MRPDFSKILIKNCQNFGCVLNFFPPVCWSWRHFTRERVYFQQRGVGDVKTQLSFPARMIDIQRIHYKTPPRQSFYRNLTQNFQNFKIRFPKFSKFKIPKSDFQNLKISKSDFQNFQILNFKIRFSKIWISKMSNFLTKILNPKIWF